MIKKTTKGVTFEYDLNTEEKVYLAGDFNDWDPTKTPLKRVGDKWKTTMKLQPGEHQFKYFTQGQSWMNDHKADKYIPNSFGTDNSVVVIDSRSK